MLTSREISNSFNRKKEGQSSGQISNRVNNRSVSKLMRPDIAKSDSSQSSFMSPINAVRGKDSSEMTLTVSRKEGDQSAVTNNHQI